MKNETLKILVPVIFTGSIEVELPVDVPQKRRDALARKVALARVLATTDNPDAPEDDACAEYEAEFGLDEAAAGQDWDDCKTAGVGGTWSLAATPVQLHERPEQPSTENDKEFGMRTWKCVGYGHTVEVSYDQLAEHGKPTCPQCGCRMELQAVATDDDLAAIVTKLTAKTQIAGLQPEDLDESVHDLASSVASDANNDGLEGQVRYLISGMGAKDADEQIDKLIADKE